MYSSIRKLAILAVTCLFTAQGVLAADVALPDLGRAGLGSISSDREEAIGRSIIAQMRDAGMIEDDPELQQYINDLGARLVGGTETRGQSFDFYIIRDDAVNAFALPGGYIGINSGLIRETRTEAELASVVAHEIAHVTQRHIARRVEESRELGLKSIAAILGAIAIAAAGGNSDAIGGSLMLGSGLIAQEQINFTRSQEYEADRVGIDILYNAQFDPDGMIAFFETMRRRQRLQGIRLPEYFSTHPLGTSRVIEATQQARQMQPAKTWESRLYPLMKRRLDVAATTVAARPAPLPEDADADARYARALEWLEYGEAGPAIEIFRELIAMDDSLIPYHLGLARALAASGSEAETLEAINEALRLFPESLPVGLTYARLQRDFGNPDRGLRYLRRLFDYRSPSPDTLRLMAQLASAAGEQAESHYYMGEFFIRQGDLSSARVQMRLAADLADLGSDARRQYEARLAAVAEALLEQRAGETRDARRRGQRVSAPSVSPSASPVY